MTQDSKPVFLLLYLPVVNLHSIDVSCFCVFLLYEPQPHGQHLSSPLKH